MSGHDLPEGVHVTIPQGSLNLPTPPGYGSHDPLCPVVAEGVLAYDLEDGCYCDVIAAVRADERERIAQAIETEKARQMCLAKAINNGRESYVARATLSAFDAARIAREGTP